MIHYTLYRLFPNVSGSYLRRDFTVKRRGKVDYETNLVQFYYYSSHNVLKVDYRTAASKCEDEMYTEQNRGKSILARQARELY